MTTIFSSTRASPQTKDGKNVRHQTRSLSSDYYDLIMSLTLRRIIPVIHYLFQAFICLIKSSCKIVVRGCWDARPLTECNQMRLDKTFKWRLQLAVSHLIPKRPDSPLPTEITQILWKGGGMVTIGLERGDRIWRYNYGRITSTVCAGRGAPYPMIQGDSI